MKNKTFEVDGWGSRCVEESWYWGNQAHTHHCIRCRCVRGIWTVCDAATSQWKDSRWIPGSARKTGSPGWRKTTWKMDGLHICCWVATACQAAALDVSVTVCFDIRSTLCERLRCPGWGPNRFSGPMTICRCHGGDCWSE